MVVDDDKTMLHYLHQSLENHGYRVSAFNDSMAALETLKNLQHDDDLALLLTDIIMPGIDGTELADKAQELFPHLQVMFITGFAASAATKKENTTMMKPLHIKALIEQINQLVHPDHEASPT